MIKANSFGKSMAFHYPFRANQAVRNVEGGWGKGGGGVWNVEGSKDPIVVRK